MFEKSIDANYVVEGLISDIDAPEFYYFIENDKIYLYLSDKSDGVFASFIDISIFNVKTSYVGYIDNQEKREIIVDQIAFFGYNSRA